MLVLQAKAMYKPKDKGTWAPKYHQYLYQITDEAVRGELPACNACALTETSLTVMVHQGVRSCSLSGPSFTPLKDLSSRAGSMEHPC